MLSVAFPGRQLTLVFLVAVGLTLVGCGGRTGPRGGTITGKVTVNGAPPTTTGTKATLIEFYGADGKLASSGLVNTDGSFVINECPPGDVQVAVQGPAIASGGGAGIPPKYNKPGNGLTYTVRKGAQTKDFDLAP
jgi:hypothetical protein